MPKSRQRKKQKKKKKRPVEKEVIDYGWVEIVRKGKNVFMRNKMTAEQHTEYLE
jgi:hypothetical protein